MRLPEPFFHEGVDSIHLRQNARVAPAEVQVEESLLRTCAKESLHLLGVIRQETRIIDYLKLCNRETLRRLS